MWKRNDCWLSKLPSQFSGNECRLNTLWQMFQQHNNVMKAWGWITESRLEWRILYIQWLFAAKYDFLITRIPFFTTTVQQLYYGNGYKERRKNNVLHYVVTIVYLISHWQESNILMEGMVFKWKGNEHLNVLQYFVILTKLRWLLTWIIIY